MLYNIFVKPFYALIKPFLSDNFLIQLSYLKYHKKIYRSGRLKTFSDKVFKIKMSKEIEGYSMYVDKYMVREFVQSEIGSSYLPELLAVYHKSSEFKLAQLPNKFALKLNNGAGSNLIVKDKSAHSESSIKMLIEQWLSSNYYEYTREKQYKNVEQCVVCEEYLDASEGLTDYKFFCFNGEPEFVQVISERTGCSQLNNFYDTDWKALNVTRTAHEVGETTSKPEGFDAAVNLSRTLSKRFQFVRVDFYLIEGRILFGELTFTPANGEIEFSPESFDRKWAKEII